MRIHFHAMLAFTLALLGAGCSNDGTETASDTTALTAPDTTRPPGTPTTDAPTANNDNTIVAMLAAMDSMEVDLGRLALQKSGNPDVKAYAEMMVADHTTMLNEGAALAAEAGITPVPPTDDETPRRHADARERLGAMEPAEFDRQYMQLMVEEHDRAVGELQRLSGQAQHPRLREHIEKGIPKVQEHRDRALELTQKVNAAG